MHILYVVHQFFPNHYTGTERLVLNLSKQMQRCGHRVTVLTYGITDSEGYEELSGFMVRHYQFQGVPVISIRHKIIDNLIDFTIIDDDMALFLETLFAGEEIDIMHICHMMRVGSVIRIAEKKAIPVILTLTDFWLICPRGIAINQSGGLCDCSADGKKCLDACYPGSYWRSLIQDRYSQAHEVISSVDTVVSATNFLKNMFQNKGFAREIKRIPFGKDYLNVRINTRTYDDNSQITIGYLSSLHGHKGAHLLIEAFMQVNPSNIQLRIYGDTSSNKEYFEVLTRIAGGDPRIEFAGKYDYESMPDILENVDVVAVPSLWWENSPLVLLRSLVHNVPAIVSDLGGLTEVISDGKNGFTFSVGYSDSLSKNAHSLSSVIRRLSDNPRLLNDLKANIIPPPHIEEEAFTYENLFFNAIRRKMYSGDYVGDKT